MFVLVMMSIKPQYFLTNLLVQYVFDCCHGQILNLVYLLIRHLKIKLGNQKLETAHSRA